MTDLLLAVAHHLLVFALVAILASESVLLRPGMTRSQLERLGRVDAGYGIAAGMLVAVGFARVFFGAKPEGYYLSNHVFWAKIGAFVVVALLSINPTVRIVGWRRRASRDPAFLPSDHEVSATRRFLLMEAAVFVLIPVFAAAMARGFGLRPG